MQILALEFDHVRVAILNRPKQLNALSHSMVMMLFFLGRGRGRGDLKINIVIDVN